MEGKLKKRLRIAFIILGFSVLSHAQVGIGILNPSNAAQLDITSSNKGLLVPRLALIQTINSVPVTGTITNSLLIYNTATTNDVSPGFYYWQTNKWVRIVAQSDPVVFNETLTTLTYNGATNELTYKDEKGILNVLQLVGQTGPQGPIGIPGNDGATGAQGPQGPIGLTGATGAQGIPGNDGATGAQGPQGPTGLTGATGTQGIPGNDGATGAQGPQGPTGLTGATGTQGIPGNDGATGAQGPQGPIGLTGATGAQGIPGNDGATGAQGPQGPTGVTGATGTQGIPGNDGATGAQGPQGPIGVTGATGTQGIPGNDGATGAQGPQGPIGVTGATGPQGIQGIPGNDGATGPQGGIGLIINGSNTTVSGAGTTIDPYKIDTPSIPVTTVANTSTVNSLTTTVNSTTGTAVNIINSNVLNAANGSLTSTVNGVASTPAIPVLIAANNGLTATNGTAQLGGILLQPVVVTTNTTNTLAVAGLQTGATTDNIVVTDANGILKTVTTAALNANNWNILGNAGTVSGTHFIGTTDVVQLNFRVGNVPAGKIGTSPGVSAGDANTYLGLNAGLADAGVTPSSTIIRNVAVGNDALRASTGRMNTAVGARALAANTTGFVNTALGWNSLSGNTTGAGNTGLGVQALNVNSTGDSNTGIGSGALQNVTTGSNNVGVGNQSGFTNTSGSENVFIGNLADASVNNLTNVIAIGSNATVAASNSMVLGGTGFSAVKVGIGINAPTNTFHVKPPSGINPVRFEGLQTGSTITDLIVVADATGVLKTVPQRGSFSSKVPISISGTVVPPAKAVTRENDFIRYRDLGNNEIEVDFLYSAINSFGGTSGSGDYLFSLPNGYQFNLTEQPIYAGAIGSNTFPEAAYALRDVKTVFASAETFITSRGIYIIPYSSTQFRIADFLTTTGAAINDLYFSLLTNQLVIAGRFTFVKQ
ncbi:hypothetical protein ACHRVZ_12135 [Flavobacterium sp. FlaQc-57]|uniref:hypothetical protein n=1 Tax=Flavobacterium sp. FlaQc-57 TaxID=3374186 RepID=UPI003757A08B